MASVPQPLDNDAFRRLLTDCRLFAAHTREGFVPFDADCVARGLARHAGYAQETALAHLARWSASLGGGLKEAILWLPAHQYGDTSSEQ